MEKFNIEYVFIGLCLLLFLYLGLSKRWKELRYLFVASLLSIVWVYFASNQYGYNSEMLMLFGLNTYPLFAWAIGLFIFVNVYFFMQNVFEFQGKVKRIFLFLGIYWTLLIFGEVIWYHVFGVHNEATAMYVGLPICDCMHAPRWMQFSYFMMGPLYFVICEFTLAYYKRIQRYLFG